MNIIVHLYLYSVVWEGDSQQVAGRTGVTVLHRAQTVCSDLKQHVWCLNVKHLRYTDGENTKINIQSIHTNLIVHLLHKSDASKHILVCLHQMFTRKMLTSTAVLAAQMMRLPSAAQVLHLTGMSSSPSVNRLLTLMDFHSLPDVTWKSCAQAKIKGTVASKHLRTHAFA